MALQESMSLTLDFVHIHHGATMPHTQALKLVFTHDENDLKFENTHECMERLSARVGVRLHV